MSVLPSYIAIDLETSIKNRGEDSIGKNQASPFHPDNKIVVGGYCGHLFGQGSHSIIPVTFFRALDYTAITHIMLHDAMLVGHNIKFDLLYLYRSPKWRYWAVRGRIWDTQLAEYLLTGQVAKMSALGDKKDSVSGNVTRQGLATKYGGTDKDDKIKEYWTNGIDTEDIPEHELKEYLKGDVENTALVFEQQYIKAKELGMLPLIESQMDALLATTEMEYNGMCFDTDLAMHKLKSLSEERDKIRGWLESHMALAGIVDPNPASDDHLACWLFGGTHKYTDTVESYPPEDPLYRYKTGARAGQVRTKKATLTKEISGVIIPRVDHPRKKNGQYSTAEDELKKYEHKMPAAISTVLDYREKEKEISTYYVPLSLLTWPTDGCIHASFNHTKTATGRLSSSSPNFQNIP